MSVIAVAWRQKNESAVAVHTLMNKGMRKANAAVNFECLNSLEHSPPAIHVSVRRWWLPQHMRVGMLNHLREVVASQCVAYFLCDTLSEKTTRVKLALVTRV